ncbi:putative receptor-like protein kinase [Citrus sinensis]|uniref:Receptor-like protein kinase n=1 Tax=Citrus sinensis TaxID=2711 RepID=A0ACB8L667_CITSI|nr:putative receptor-like protein kinase [Citrus sinensis]
MLSSISIFCCLATLSLSLLLHSHKTICANSNETDRLALLAIKSQLHDPLGVTSSWNNSMNLCQWTGVICGRRHQRVTRLDLRNQSIGGTLSPYVGNLSFLRYINLANNGFLGEIPPQIGRQDMLEGLVLSNNSFSGTIPTNLSRCSNLIELFVDTNYLVGEIPAAIGGLFKLERLFIFHNHITGQLPASIGNLSSLLAFDVRENILWGRIDSLVQLRNLLLLDIAFNHFSGTIPPPIFNISSLEVISLSENRFTGSLPVDTGVNLPNLRQLSPNGNNFTGSIPVSLSNASRLEMIEFSRNQFSGRVSVDFSRLKNLSWLNMGINNLGTGTANELDFINLLTNCSKLERLYFNRNRFEGELPHSVANLSSTIKQIAMGRNRISGTIPPEIRKLVSLNWLTIDRNQLTGTIPPEIGELKNLQLLNLGGNFLQGSIPSSLGNLTLLTYLILGFNNLQGIIPSSLANCNSLLGLNVSHNKLTGTFPQQILSITTISLYLALDNNLLNGPLPPQVGNFKTLMRLDVSGNKFSGEIPATLSACTVLEYLNISGNSFGGSIPLSLESLKSIEELDLSSNNLTGQIPEYLKNLPFLEFLNLSYNHFEGEVPTKGVFNNKTRFSIAGNGKLCGGLDELHLPSCQSKGSLTTLLKVVIPVTVSCLISSVCFTVVYVWRRRSSRKASNMLLIERQLLMDSYAELSKATDNFSPANKIGEGGFGIVYKGILGKNRTEVAVKVINLEQKGASKSFVAECKALRNIRHRNLIKIITICSGRDSQGVDFKAIVYEYMQNGSLEEWLHQSNDQLEVYDLSLTQRLNIAIDVACAIEYLHYYCEPSIVHGDLKPSNVLLDQDVVAHVSDFGLAKFLSSRNPDTAVETRPSSTGIRGTVGYVAPEYGMGRGASMKGDVYSFGILLLELFTRRRPTDAMFSGGLTLHEFAKMSLPEKVIQIVDSSLLSEVMASSSKNTTWRDGRARAEDCFETVIRIGVHCSMESPTERMEMRDVVARLCHARETFLGRTTPRMTSTSADSCTHRNWSEHARSFPSVNPPTLNFPVNPIPHDPSPSKDLKYSGRTDPLVHIERFNDIIRVKGLSQAQGCRVFLLSLEGRAHEWYRKLSLRSIKSFEQMCQEFAEQFRGAMALKDDMMELTSMK